MPEGRLKSAAAFLVGEACRELRLVKQGVFGKGAPGLGPIRRIPDQGDHMGSAARIVGNTFIAVIFILLGGVGFELVARIVDGAKATKATDPDQHAARPPATKESADRKIRDLMVAFDNKYTYDQTIQIYWLTQNQLKYRPWVQIGNADHNNPYSIVENGIRKTVAGKHCAVASPNGQTSETKPKTVWFFGGSTTYGIGVPWWDTMPSKFVEEADRDGACVVAVNFGVPYFFSRQEAIYFVLTLMKERAPDAVVFLDGLNDISLPGSSIRTEPFFTPTLDKLIPIGPELSMNAIESKSGSGFTSRLQSLFRDSHMLRWLGLSHGTPQSGAEEAYTNRKAPQSEEFSTDERAAHAIVDRYLTTRNFISKVCESYAVRCFEFLQPVVAVDYNPQMPETVTEEARIRTDETERLAAGYPIMREAFRSSDARCAAGVKGLEYMDLSALFKTYDGIPYVNAGVILHRRAGAKMHHA